MTSVYASLALARSSRSFPHASLSSLVTLALTLAALSGCAHHASRKSTASIPPPPKPARIGETETGVASWYGNPYHGRATASGEIFDMEQFTAAHRTLAFQTWVDVTNLSNGKHVEVRVTDRGPFVDGRIIDLSLAAAREIDMVRSGTARVRLKVIPPPRIEPQPTVEPVVTAVVDDGDATPAESSRPFAPPSSPADSKRFSVQAGAFADRGRAEALRDTLGDRLPVPVKIVEAPGTRARWHVLAGSGLSDTEASALAVEIRTLAGAAIVVPDDARPTGPSDRKRP